MTQANSNLPPDIHECGAAPYPNCPNGPHVRIFFDQFGMDHPQALSVFFIDKSEKGYFRDLKPIKKIDFQKNWSQAKVKNETYSFWGEYSFERVEQIRERYFISIRYKRNFLKAYKIVGPNINNPDWIELETEEK